MTLYFEAFVQDISERRAAEEELKASEERYRLLFEGNSLPMLVYDLEHSRLPCRQRGRGVSVRVLAG